MEESFDVKYLLTTVNDTFKRVSMHGVREELLNQQAESIGIPLLKIWVQEGTNEEYEKQMETVLVKSKSEGIRYVIFGDIFLEDLREYREQNLARVGMEAVFPLWKMNTHTLIQNFINQKFKAIVCCTNDEYLGKGWLGRRLDQVFLQELPVNVDPCGENGEYHTFCYEGSIFRKKIDFTVGEKVFKALEIKAVNPNKLPTNTTTKGFWYCDLLPTV